MVNLLNVEKPCKTLWNYVRKFGLKNSVKNSLNKKSVQKTISSQFFPSFPTNFLTTNSPLNFSYFFNNSTNPITTTINIYKERNENGN